MSNARRYRDNGGRVWETRGNHYMAHLVRDVHGREVGFDYSAPFSTVSAFFGSLTQIPADKPDEVPEAARYFDRDGDVWTDDGDGNLRLTKSYAVPGSEGITGRFAAVADEYGPLTREGSEERFGTFADGETEDNNADEATPSREQKRGIALTVGVMLAHMTLGGTADGRDIANTAEEYALFILDEV